MKPPGPARILPAQLSPGETAPDVSVVIANYNMGQYVAAAVQSVLDQPDFCLEVIVVDDGSTDGSLAALEPFRTDPRVRIIAQPNRGQPRAKNAGLHASRGRYVAFCDADDYWLPNKLRVQIPILERKPEVGVVYSPFITIDGAGRISQPPPFRFYRGKVLETLFQTNIVPFGTAVVRRSCLEQWGGFDESIPMGIDWELWLRLAVRWEFDFADEATYVYRVWEGQMSKNWRGRYDYALRIMDQFLERHPGMLPANIVRTAYADTYTNLAAATLADHGLAAAIAPLRRAFSYRLGYWPTWRLLLSAPIRALKAPR